MRKRSAYRPKPVIRDPLSYVISGLRPVSTATEAMTLLGVKNHGAVEAVRTGLATREQVNFLVHAFNMAHALACLGQGADWLAEIVVAQDAIKAASCRPKFLFTGPELQAVNLGLDIHDAQMADPKTTVQLLERAAAGLAQLQRRGFATRIQFEPKVTP